MVVVVVAAAIECLLLGATRIFKYSLGQAEYLKGNSLRFLLRALIRTVGLSAHRHDSIVAPLSITAATV
jgi:hypothetical protein